MSQVSTMRAAVIDGPNAAFRVARVPLPIAGAGQVLVKIMASGLNPLDVKIRAGQAAHARHPFPAILGIDMAGTIEALGEGVSSFRVGDDVYGMTGGVGGVQGSLAEYAAVDVRLIAGKPANLSMREAASLPLAFITAWEGLVDRVAIRPGQKVLVQGGAGGVGRVAVQIAIARGAIVFATGSANSSAAIAAYGATAIDYNASMANEYVERYTEGRGFDVVFDTVGGATLDESFKSVARFGHVASALGWGTHALAPLSFRGGTYSGVFTLLPLLTGEGKAHHGEILREATALAEAGELAPMVDKRTFDLTTVGDAFALIEQQKAQGKVVVEP